MKTSNYLTKLFFHCLTKLTQQMYHFKGLLVGFVGDFLRVILTFILVTRKSIYSVSFHMGSWNLVMNHCT